MYRDDHHAAATVHRQNRSPTRQNHHIDHDFDGSAEICTTLVHAIADVAGVDVTDVESALSDHFDIDALNSLFRTDTDGAVRRTGRIQFIILQCETTIYSDGRITIVPVQQPPHVLR